MKIDKKNYSQVLLEECRYEIKRKNMVRYIDAELEMHVFDGFDSK